MMSLITLGAVFCALIAVAFWRLFRQCFTRSPLDKLPGPPPRGLSIIGNLKDLTDAEAAGKRMQYLAETYGPALVIPGILGERMLHLYDPKALHSVFIKDVENFPHDLNPSNDLRFLLGPGLLTTEGSQHRRQRKILNPVFSVAHLRNMTNIFYDIAHKLRRALETRVSQDPEEVDVNGWMARTTLEMLGQAGLGYSFDNFVDDSTDDFGEAIKMFFPLLTTRLPLLGFLIAWISNYISEPTIRFILRSIPYADLQRILDIGDTMARRSQEIIDEKKAALAKGDEEQVQRVGEGKDIMSVLLRDNMSALDAEKLSNEELVAQMSTFILAGMDTTSNALSRILHILAQHPTAQDKLRAEIREARGCGNSVDDGTDISYDDLVKLPYLDAVCRETLRLYSPVPLLLRRAAKDMVLPLQWPVRGKDGSLMTEVLVPEGTLIIPSLQASNCNKALWGDDAMEWKPERWLEQLPVELEEVRIPGVYSHLMTFSGGTRSCIGFKFSQLETKVVLSVLVAKFKFELTDKPIVWKTSAVTYPTMGSESSKPEMILKMSRI
ncbi:cytochrome P450 [Lentinus tigrinus ALCF2SS1-7]|uniref:Cytochrome P450 n=1 Tax=Lentinus tigrinus ALCF2SS1-6 TaxID=1328759 RepID=A0A5C2RVR2_9APHY|nr:cytochrome P450 [Lentinus tigrinus ALCF2SS1-6]RPD71283.1 cytochrome P450 [Lentinus tigrinus ALCF2SS1-7]